LIVVAYKKAPIKKDLVAQSVTFSERVLCILGEEFGIR
jgi:hypothetical protein